jgi:hypothetical protein
MRNKWTALVWLVAGVLLCAQTGLSVQTAQAAVRHRSYVGTITAISVGSLTIYSKAHATDFRFIITSQTAFLQKSKPIARSRFKVGSYVTVSFSPGPNNSMVAWHISLRG